LTTSNKGRGETLLRAFSKHKIVIAEFTKQRMKRTITFATPMKIVVNTGVLLKDHPENYCRFLYEVLGIIVN
jgi:hypothetical protein